jgi:ferredoxin
MVGLEKAEQHYRFPNKEIFGEFLTDLNVTANAQYAIMDAIVGMDGPGGPGSGNPIKLNFLAASDNILALDWKCASLVGYNPHRIPNLDAALKRGVWLSSEKDITTIGENESNCKCPNFKIVKNPSKTLQIMIPGWVNFIAKKFFEKTPNFNPKKCVRCGRCKQICPAHIIELNGKNKTAKLSDKNKCLHCFCCHEICPEDAIKLKRF